MGHTIDILNQSIWIKWRKWKQAQGFNVDTEGWKDNESALNSLLNGYNPSTKDDNTKKLKDENSQLSLKINKLNRKVSYAMGVIDKELPAKMTDAKKEFDKIDKG